MYLQLGKAWRGLVSLFIGNFRKDLAPQTQQPWESTVYLNASTLLCLLRVLKKHHDWEILVGVRNMGNSYMNKGW